MNEVLNRGVILSQRCVPGFRFLGEVNPPEVVRWKGNGRATLGVPLVPRSGEEIVAPLKKK